MNINFEITDYRNEEDNRQLVELYKKVFHTTFNELGYLFKPGPFGSPLGALAKTDDGILVGHFGTMATQGQIKSGTVRGRVSFGTMVDGDYRGMSIARNLMIFLLDYLKAENICDFVIGIPNENALHVHNKYLGYIHMRDYHMRTIAAEPSAKPIKVHRLEELPSDMACEKNYISHNKEMLDWHYGKEGYFHFADDKGNCYICNTYRDSMQLLYWSAGAGEEEVIGFANYIYDNYDVASVRTWDVYDWLDRYEPEERAYHFALNPINDSLREELLSDWTFYPGDCELF